MIDATITYLLGIIFIFFVIFNIILELSKKINRWRFRRNIRKSLTPPNPPTITFWWCGMIFSITPCNEGWKINKNGFSFFDHIYNIQYLFEDYNNLYIMSKSKKGDTVLYKLKYNDTWRAIPLMFDGKWWFEPKSGKTYISQKLVRKCIKIDQRTIHTD